VKVNRRDFQTLAQTRLAESKALLKAGFPSGAYYLAGYAVECALKACIAKRTRRHDLPDKKDVDASYTHNLIALVRAAKLESHHDQAVRLQTEFKENWETTERWSERSRYEVVDEEAAQQLIRAVSQSKYGVLTWLKVYW
jgi:HEPN domain-containing protein